MPGTLPVLSDPGHRAELGRGLGAAGVGLVVLDPLYLCLGRGPDPASPANLFEVGPVLARAAEACLSAGATPVLVHHTLKRGRGHAGGGPDLDNLAYVGAAEFARQWPLLSRHKPYRPGTGRHELVLRSGGVAGQPGEASLTVDEGAAMPTGCGRSSCGCGFDPGVT